MRTAHRTARLTPPAAEPPPEQTERRVTINVFKSGNWRFPVDPNDLQRLSGDKFA
jgi:hypothetical protein